MDDTEGAEVTNQSSNSKKKQSKQKKLAEKIAIKKLAENFTKTQVQSIHGAAPEEHQTAKANVDITDELAEVFNTEAAANKQKATGVFDQLNELYDEDLANRE